jgi:hypothetical protein
MLAHFQILEIGFTNHPSAVKCISFCIQHTLLWQQTVFFLFPFFLALSNVIISLLDRVNAILKKYQDWDILNLMRSQVNIKNELLILFRNGSWVCIHTPFCYLWSYWCFQKHREMQFEDLLKKLLVLDSIALSANIDVLVADGNTYEEIVETKGVGAQSLVNLLHAVCL